MSLQNEFSSVFDDDEVVVANDIKFKAALGIGEQAFKSMRVRENLTTFSEALGVGTAVAGVANTVTIGSLLGFSSGGLLGTGLFASSTVPGLNVIVAAGVISAGAYVGLSRFFAKGKESKVMVIPKFINTPLDLLATSIASFFIPLGLKIGLADGNLEPVEELKLKKYLIDEWGFAAPFVAKMTEQYKTEKQLGSYKDLLSSFGEFIDKNEDCDPEEIKASLMILLRQISEADGVLSEKEEIELKFIDNLLKA